MNTACFQSQNIMHSHEHERSFDLRLNDTQDWDRELRVMVQTEKYIRQKNDAGITPTLKRILQDRADENRVRKTRIMQMLEHAIQDAEVFAMGQKIPVKAAQARSLIDEGLEYLVRIFYKFSYLQYLCDNPQNEVKAVLQADDLAKLPMESSECNPAALKETRTQARPDVQKSSGHIERAGRTLLKSPMAGQNGRRCCL